MSSLKEILDKVAKREVSPSEAEKMLQLLAIDKVGCLAKLDGNRGLRRVFQRLFWLKAKLQVM
jgi:NCAIR mutase (PurE)-related protein